MALTTNLVSYYKLDESSGNAADSVGGFTLTNTNTVTYSAGKINNGADGGASNSNKSLQVSNNLGFTDSTDVTWSQWVNVTTAPTEGQQQCFTNHYINGGKGRFWMYTMTGGVLKLRMYQDAGAPSTLDITQTLTTGTWYHIVVTYLNSSNLTTVYVNGSSVGTINFGARNAVSPDYFSILNWGGGTLPWKGLVDEVGVWSRVLSGTEINSLYNGGAGLQWPFSTTSIKTINGLAKASIKTINGLAIASVKTFNGVA